MRSSAIAEYLGDTVDGLTWNPTTSGGNVFIDRVPASPDTVVIITELGGQVDVASGHYVQGFQIRTRGDADDVIGPRSLAMAISQALNSMCASGPTTINVGGDEEVLVILSTAGTPASIGWDENDRGEWVVRLSVRCESEA